MVETVMARRALVEKHIFPKMQESIRFSPLLEASLKDLVESVEAQALEGLVAKGGIPNMSVD
jgi:ATP-dependent DNA ligase